MDKRVKAMETHSDADASQRARCAILTEMLSLLRALQWNYQTAHWQSQGDSFYGDHLLFQRLYEGLSEEIDSLAEKTVGLLGRDAEGHYHFGSLTQIEKAKIWLESWSAYECLHKRSLYAEKTLQAVWKAAYEYLKGAAGPMSLGLDDWIMSSANAHETNLYLLQQRLADKERVRWASQDLLRGWYRPDLSAPRRSRRRQAQDKSPTDDGSD